MSTNVKLYQVIECGKKVPKPTDPTQTFPVRINDIQRYFDYSWFMKHPKEPTFKNVGAEIARTDSTLFVDTGKTISMDLDELSNKDSK